MKVPFIFRFRSYFGLLYEWFGIGQTAEEALKNMCSRLLYPIKDIQCLGVLLVFEKETYLYEYDEPRLINEEN